MTLLPGMTLTPAAGTYLVWFTCRAAIGAGTGENNSMDTQIFVGGTAVAASLRRISLQSAADISGAISQASSMASMARVTVDGTQAIEARGRNNTGIGTVTERQLAIQETT